MLATLPSYIGIGGLNLTSWEDSGVQWITESVTGLGAPAGTLAPVQKPRQAGAWAGLSYATPRSMVISGTTAAPTAALALDALDRLNVAFSLDEVPMTVVQGGISRTVNVRRDGDVLPVWLSDTVFTWSVQVAALDPRMFGTPVSGSTLLPMTTGGLVLPLGIPFDIPSTVVSGQLALTNPGNETGPVVCRIDGPATGPQITHVGSGLALTLASSLVLGAGEWLTIDMEARTVMANDQSSRNGYITSRGWFGFDPGVNVFSFTAVGYNAASLLTVNAIPAWK